MLKLAQPFRNLSFFSKVKIWAPRIKKFLFQFLVDFFPFGYGSVYQYILVDPDPESQILAAPTDPDQ